MNIQGERCIWAENTNDRSTVFITFTWPLVPWHSVAHAHTHSDKQIHTYTHTWHSWQCVWEVYIWNTHSLSLGDLLHRERLSNICTHTFTRCPCTSTNVPTQAREWHTHIYTHTERQTSIANEWLGGWGLRPASGKSPNHPKIMCQLSCKASPSFHGDRSHHFTLPTCLLPA